MRCCLVIILIRRGFGFVNMDFGLRGMNLMILTSVMRLRNLCGKSKSGWRSRGIGGMMSGCGVDGREYCVLMEGEVSFRIQVALRSILVEEEVVRKFMEGKDDGAAQEKKVDTILRGILKMKVSACETALSTKVDGPQANISRLLWESELEIARVAL